MDDYLGGGVIPLKDVVSGKLQNGWMPLYESKNPKEIRKDTLFSKMVNFLTNEVEGEILINVTKGNK